MYVSLYIFIHTQKHIMGLQQVIGHDVHTHLIRHICVCMCMCVCMYMYPHTDTLYTYIHTHTRVLFLHILRTIAHSHVHIHTLSFAGPSDIRTASTNGKRKYNGSKRPLNQTQIQRQQTAFKSNSNTTAANGLQRLKTTGQIVTHKALTGHLFSLQKHRHKRRFAMHKRCSGCS